MKESNYYFGRDIQRPQKDDFTKVFAYSGGLTLFGGTHAEYLVFKSHGVAHITEIVIDKSFFEIAQKNYKQKIQQRRAEFKTDLFQENNHIITLASQTVSRLKVEQCFDLAVTIVDDVLDCQEEEEEDYFEKIEDVFCRMVIFLS